MSMNWAELTTRNGCGRGATVIEPEFTRALVNLSRGGSDAVIVREFDMLTREFVADGFELPEAKSQIGWADPDTVLVGTDFGADSLTESGYPRIVKRWRRGTPLTDAETIFEGARTDVSAAVDVDRTPGFERTFVAPFRSTSGTARRYELRGPELIRIDVPTDASSMSIHREWLLIELRTDWSVGAATYRAGSLLAANYDEFLAGTTELQVVFEPDEHTCLHQYAWTRDRLLLVTLADVASRVEIVTPGSWQREPISGIPAATNTVIVAADDTGDEFFLDSSGFDSPSRLLRGTDGGPLEQIKSAPAFFDAENLDVQQYFVRIRGRHVDPVLRGAAARAEGPAHAAGRLRRIRDRPTHRATAACWAGCGWPAAAPTRWPTFAAAASTGRAGTPRRCARAGTRSPRTSPRWQPIWCNRGITTVEQLGAQGGSNGGLLMGIMLTKYPEKFGALVCDVPLLDMKRYHLLLAGASWVAEYGDPDNPDDWEFISEYSPYQNISATRKYPPVLFTTSTRDDRVHPGHARKMVAALAGRGSSGLVLREHRGRPRRRGGQRAARLQVGAELLVFAPHAGGPGLTAA